MALKKSELSSSLWSRCDALRGGMDASQYKDYVLVLLLIKYVSDKSAGVPFAPITIPEGASFKGKEIIAQIIAETGWSMVFDDTPQQERSFAVALACLPADVRVTKGPALHLERQEVSLTLDTALPEPLRHAATEKFHMEINTAYWTIEEAFRDRPETERPYRKSLKTLPDGTYIELAFLMPEVGARHQELLAPLAAAVGYAPRVNPEPNQINHPVSSRLSGQCGSNVLRHRDLRLLSIRFSTYSLPRSPGIPCRLNPSSQTQAEGERRMISSFLASEYFFLLASFFHCMILYAYNKRRLEVMWWRSLRLFHKKGALEKAPSPAAVRLLRRKLGVEFFSLISMNKQPQNPGIKTARRTRRGL